MPKAVPSLIQQTGEALYGERWQTELARDLGVVDRTMRRWVAGDTAIPPGAYLDLLRLTQERAMLLHALAEPLKRAGAP